MKKKTLLLGTCLCLMLSFAACGKSEKKTDTPDPTETVTGTEDPTGEPTTEAPTTEVSPSTPSSVKVTLGQYKNLEITKQSTEVTEDEIQAQLDSFNDLYGNPIPLTDRADVQDGDTVNIDFIGKVDGVAFDGGTATGSALTIGSDSFIDGFEDGLIGKHVGETVDIPCTFPDPYTRNPDLAGKEAVFTVKINFIDSGKRETLTDDVVAANDTNGSKTIDELKEYIKTTLKKNKENSAESQKEIDILTKAIDNATFDGLDQSEIDSFEEYMTNSYNQYAAQLGADLETYVNYLGLTMDKFKEEIKKAAEFNVREKYLLEEVVKQENLELTDEEYTAGRDDYMGQYNYTDATEFENAMGGKEAIEDTILLDKAKQLILDSAVINE